MQDQNNPGPIYGSTEPDSKSSQKREILSTLAIIIIAPLVALFLTAFVFQSYEVDGPSMEKTLFNKDRLLVNKTSRTWARITGHAYEPKRYDVVIFNHTENYGLDGVTDKQLIKRVIGLPGDRVVVKDGVVRVYNKENPDGFLVDQKGPEAAVIGETTASSEIDQTINEGEVFVMGDNRPNSLDSRAFGPIDLNDIVGKLSVRIYPFNEITKF